MMKVSGITAAVPVVVSDEPMRAIRDVQGDICSPWKPRGLDAIDRTSVLDIKPYMLEFAARGAVRQSEWARELRVG